MNHAEPLASLVTSLGSSLAMYVADAGIWTYPGEEEIKLALADVAGDLRSIVERAGAALEGRSIDVPRPVYPIRFTATHDLDLRGLLPRIIAELRAIGADLERRQPSVADGEAAGLVQDALTSVRTHVDALEQLLARPRAAAG